MAAPVLLFVPLDDRPVTMDMLVDLGRSAGVDVRAPVQASLGNRDRPGDPDAVWEWLRREAAQSRPAALIASVEMLCFGGLVASRKSDAVFEEVAPRLRRIAQLARDIPTYLSAVIPRTPQVPTDEDPHDSLTGPHRARHLRLNTELIEMAAQGVLRFALIGQDDTWPGSPSQADRVALQEHADRLDASNVLLTSGADELNVRLLAQWLNDLTGSNPAVRIVYTYPQSIGQVPLYEAAPLSQTVAEHVRSTGCRMVPSPPEGSPSTHSARSGRSTRPVRGRRPRASPRQRTSRAGEGGDILLWVHNFTGQQREAVGQTGEFDLREMDAVLSAVGEAGRQERVVALADVRFANGADRALVTRLLDEPRFAGIVAYAGWNTCSNSLGAAAAQATVAYHLRASSVPGNDRVYRAALFTRLLDDWGYQAVVRAQLARWLEREGGDASRLGAHEAAAETLALERFQTDVLPALQASFPHHPVTLSGVTFPWHRLFEVRLQFEGLP